MIKRATLGMFMILALVVASCAPAASPGGSGSKEPIKIGSLSSTTGPTGSFGDSELKAAQLAFDKVNAAGGINGRPLEITHYDTEGKPDLAVTYAKRLVESDNVVGLLGLLSVGLEAGVRPIVEEAKRVHISCEGGQNLSNAQPWSFTTQFGGFYGSEASLFYAKEKGYDTVGYLLTADAVGDAGNVQVPQVAQIAGVKLVGPERVLPTDTDATPQLAKLKAAGAKAVLFYGVGSLAAVIAKNFKTLNMPGVFLGQAPELPLLDLLGDAADIFYVAGVKLAAYEQLADSDPAKKQLTEFSKDFEQKAGRPVDQNAACGYDAASIMAEALKAAGTDSTKMRDYIEKLQGYQGVMGVYNYGPDDHNGFAKNKLNWIMLRAAPAQKKYVLVPAKFE